MRFKLYMLVVCMPVLWACSAEKQLEKPSANSGLDGFELLDEALNSISNVWDMLPVSLSLTNEAVSLIEDNRFVFLRLQKKDCDVCIVNTISYLNEFQAASETGQKVYLIIDEMTPKEKANFLGSFKLNNIEVVFIKSLLSKLDEIGEGAYFGRVYDGMITDALPVNQLFVKEFIFSFLKKGVQNGC